VALAGVGVLLLVPGDAPLASRLLGHPLGLALVAVAVAAALLAAWALVRGRVLLARAAAAGQVAAMLWGWLLAQHPWLVPGRLTIADAAAPERTLRLAVVVLAAGAVVLLPSLWYLFRVFGGVSAAASRRRE
jgi:cytochrome d ubiquinol oxidase subunit II